MTYLIQLIVYLALTELWNFKLSIIQKPLCAPATFGSEVCEAEGIVAKLVFFLSVIQQSLYGIAITCCISLDFPSLEIISRKILYKKFTHVVQTQAL